MSTENIHLALLNSLDKPETVKKMLRNPKISVSYSIKQSTEGKTLKMVTPILAVFSQILMVSLYTGSDLKKLKYLLESAKLMTRHRTYKESLKYEFESVAKKNINGTLQYLGTKNGETYKSLMESGFTLKSFANNTKLTNALIEEQAFGFGKKSVAQKESMKKTLKEVKSILNKPNLPAWAIILFIVIAFLIITGGGFYGRKRYLRRRRSLRNYKKNMENYMKKLNKRKFISSSQYVAELKGKY
tara:strand:- start:6638 stop:7369 length:732 start_codon:yes stop_codon:yes gene_type:complete